MTSPRLPADIEQLLSTTLTSAKGALGKSLAEILDQIGRDAFQVGYHRGYEDGWEAAEGHQATGVTTRP